MHLLVSEQYTNLTAWIWSKMPTTDWRFSVEKFGTSRGPLFQRGYLELEVRKEQNDAENSRRRIIWGRCEDRTQRKRRMNKKGNHKSYRKMWRDGPNKGKTYVLMGRTVRSSAEQVIGLQVRTLKKFLLRHYILDVIHRSRKEKLCSLAGLRLQWSYPTNMGSNHEKVIYGG